MHVTNMDPLEVVHGVPFSHQALIHNTSRKLNPQTNQLPKHSLITINHQEAFYVASVISFKASPGRPTQPWHLPHQEVGNLGQGFLLSPF